jgi:hypothetical protein
MIVTGTATGTGIWQVKILVPIPIPMAVPVQNLRVYPYPCKTLLFDGEKEYKVETILDSQMRYNRLKYLVKWKGYDESHN